MLSKSKYVAGLQCLKRLWLLKNKAELVDAVSESTQARFDAGNRIGELAQSLFPDGEMMTFPKNGNFGPMIAKTKELLTKGASVIYEAAFSEEGVLVLCDILLKTENGYDCYEIKSSTKVKSYHLHDAAIQNYVLLKAGLPIDRMFVMTLNPNYYMDGQGLNLEELFVSHDVSDQILERQSEIPSQISSMKTALASQKEPLEKIGPHCNDPFPCEFKNYCWPTLPQPNVFNIPRIGNRAWALYNAGKVSFKDLDSQDLSLKQGKYVEGQMQGLEKLNKPKLKAWLSDLDFPLYFLDFETIMPPLPLYPKTRPYQPHLAVQYSLHVLKEPNGELLHYEFLPDFGRDFRSELAHSLIENLDENGTILAYNQGFEKACIKRLIDWNQDLDQELQAILSRFQDLIVPFRKAWYYKPAMQGSNSIKSVYPALLPNSELQYSGLSISNGDQATRALLELAESGINPEEPSCKSIKQDLLAYCKLDTLAMVKIYQHLLEEVSDAAKASLV